MEMGDGKWENAFSMPSLRMSFPHPLLYFCVLWGRIAWQPVVNKKVSIFSQFLPWFIALFCVIGVAAVFSAMHIFAWLHKKFRERKLARQKAANAVYEGMTLFES